MGRVAVQNPTAEQLPDEKQAGRRVLIVDHDENVLIALKRLLEEASYDTTTAQSGMKALQLLRQRAFDLVLLDDHLPDVSGEEVVRHVKSAGWDAGRGGAERDPFGRPDCPIRASRCVLLHQRAQSGRNRRTRARLPRARSVSVRSFLKRPNR